MQYFLSATLQELCLEHQIGRGSEATIYRVKGDPAVVAKIYHHPNTVPREKLEYMLSNPPDDPGRAHNHVSLAWIRDGIVDNSAQTIGYLMPHIEKGLPLHRLYTPRERRLDFPGADWGVLHRCARHLARTVAAIHAEGYVVGDLHETNILAQPDGLIALIDTDLFQTRRPDGKVFRCPSGKPEYLAPELQGKALESLERSETHDCFALGVLIFYVLMEGMHPFQGQGEPHELVERIRQGLYPYDSSHKPSCLPPVASPPFEMLHPEVQKLFQRCFAAGQHLPGQRPKAEEWSRVLEGVERELLVCQDSAQHLYFRRSKRCPWCERKSLLKGRDPFPAPQLERHLPGQQALPSYSTAKHKQAHSENTFSQANTPAQVRKPRLRRILFWICVLVALVALLALPYARNAIQNGKALRTKADMRVIGIAFETYKHEHGAFPSAKDGEIFSSYLLPLEFYESRYRDHWKTSFRYASNGETFRLISYGKDKKPGKSSGSQYDADIILENGRFLREVTDIAQLSPLEPPDSISSTPASPATDRKQGSTDTQGKSAEWERVYKSTEKVDVSAIHVLPDGGVLVGAQLDDSALVIKFDGQGEEIWKRILEITDGKSTLLSDLQIANSGEYVVTGLVRQKEDDRPDRILCRLSPEPELEWTCTSYQNSLYALYEVHALQLLPGGGAAIAGCAQVTDSDEWKTFTQDFDSTYEFIQDYYEPSETKGKNCGYAFYLGMDAQENPYRVVAGSNGEQGVISQWNLQQKLVWRKKFNGLSVKALEPLADGGFLVFGTGERFWFTRLDAEGNEVWGKRFQDSAHIPAAFLRTNNGDYLLAGYTRGSEEQEHEIWLMRLGLDGGNFDYIYKQPVEFPVEVGAITQTHDGSYVLAGSYLKEGAKKFLIKKIIVEE